MMLNNNDNKFQIVLCELHNPYIHGIDENSDKFIAGHYLVHSRYTRIIFNNNNFEEDSEDEEENDGENDEEEDNIYKIISWLKIHIYRNIIRVDMYNHHPFIRNYKTIISNENYINPEIALVVYLSGGECVAILKTFWLRIIQRTWKRIYKTQMEVRLLRSNPSSLRYRENTGKWPKNCWDYPLLQGMLSQIKK